MARSRPQQHLEGLLKETRRLARRNKRKLGPHLFAEISALQAEGQNALASGDEVRIARANAVLDDAATRHLAPLRRSFAREAAEMVVVAVLLAAAVRLFVVEAYRIPSGSMVPTLLPGDVVLVSKSSYGVRLPGGREIVPGALPERGDVVVFDNPREPGATLIKRVVGLPGDVVTLVGEQVHLGGEAQPRTQVAERYDYWNFSDSLRYWHPQSGNLYLEEIAGRRYATVHSRLLPRPRPEEGPFEVPPGHLFVLGDNRDDSEDGRSGGGWYVPVDALRGRAVLVAFSWGRDGWWPGDEVGIRFARILRLVDGAIPEADEMTLDDAAASLRVPLAAEPAEFLPPQQGLRQDARHAPQPAAPPAR